MVNQVNQKRQRAARPRRAPAPDTWRAFERHRDRGLGHVLLKAARLFDEHARSRVLAAGGAPLRAAHTQLFPHLGPEGLRLSELAARLGVSKPAVGKLVAELETRGVVRVAPDPTDGRAKLVFLSRRGQRAFLHGIGVMSDLERDLAALLGRARLRDLREALAALVVALDGEGPLARG